MPIKRLYVFRDGTRQVYDLEDYVLFKNNKDFRNYYNFDYKRTEQYKNRDIDKPKPDPRPNDKDNENLLKAWEMLTYPDSRSAYEIARILFDVETTYYYAYKRFRDKCIKKTITD